MKWEFGGAQELIFWLIHRWAVTMQEGFPNHWTLEITGMENYNKLISLDVEQKEGLLDQLKFDEDACARCALKREGGIMVDRKG